MRKKTIKTSEDRTKLPISDVLVVWNDGPGVVEFSYRTGELLGKVQPKTVMILSESEKRQVFARALSGEAQLTVRF